MTGIVVVSHSLPLAEAAVELARQMTGSDGPAIEVAAGVDGGLGTDASAISEAITAAMDDDGVVVFTDIGSAIMSAETALEFLDPDDAEKVTLTWAPLVEGLVGAAVTAAGGADRTAVASEAELAAEAKRRQIAG